MRSDRQFGNLWQFQEVSGNHTINWYAIDALLNLLKMLQDAEAKLESQRQVLEPFCSAQHDSDSNSSGQTGKQGKTPVDLGTARTLAAFQETIGVFYSRKHISPVALRGCGREQDVQFECRHEQLELMADSAVSH